MGGGGVRDGVSLVVRHHLDLWRRWRGGGVEMELLSRERSGVTGCWVSQSEGNIDRGAV